MIKLIKYLIYRKKKRIKYPKGYNSRLLPENISDKLLKEIIDNQTKIKKVTGKYIILPECYNLSIAYGCDIDKMIKAVK